MRRGASASTIVLLFLSAALVSAQDNGAPDDEPERILIEEEYLESDPRSVTTQVTVITEEEIEASAPGSAADIVASVTGVQVSRYGGATEPSMVSIRGSSPEQVLVLINGKRLNSAQGGGVDLGSISPDAIERIEIVRGGSSALFGESAFGGVINIITKEGYGKEFEHSAEYSFSSYYTHELSLQSLGPIGKKKSLDYFISLHGLSTRGGYTYPDSHNDGEDTVRENSDGLMGDGSFKLGWTLHQEAGLRIGLSGQLSASEKGVPGLVEFPTVNARMEDVRGMGLLTFAWERNPVAAVTLDAHFTKQYRRYADPGYYLGPVEDTHDNSAFGTNLELSRKDDFRSLFLTTAAGYSFRYDHLLSSGLVVTGGTDADGTVYRTAHSLFFREEISLFPFRDTGVGRVQLIPAIRYDADHQVYSDGSYDSASGKTSLALGAMVSLDRDKRFLIKGNIATTYRAPSFDDLFWPSTAFAAGNPELLPEEALVIDTGVLLQPFKFLSLEAVFYNQDVNNLIQWNPGASGQWQPTNVGTALIRGVETEVKLLFPLSRISTFLTIAGNYTLLYAVDTSEGSSTYGMQLTRRARHTAKASITLSHEKGHSLFIGGRYVGRRYITARNTKYLDPYFVLDLTINAQPLKFLGIRFSIKNLLNQEYIDVREFPIPGREFECSVKISL